MRGIKEISIEEKNNIIEYGKNNQITHRAAAQMFNVKKSVIENLFKIAGLNKKDIKSLNINYFETIDTEEKAYWLGFIYADGSIQDKELEIGLNIADISHLEKFKTAIQSEHKISTKEETNSCRIVVTRTEFVNHLKNHGVKKNKTYKKMEIPNMRYELFPHFVRGFFDGDGCISSDLSMCSFTGNDSDFMLEIINRFDIKLSDKAIRKKSNTSAVDIRMYGDNMRKFLTIIYSNANIYLDRKFELYKKVCK